MIKFTGSKDGKLLIGLGLTEKNLELLKAGKPILVKGEDLELPFPCQILVLYGEDEEKLTEIILKGTEEKKEKA